MGAIINSLNDLVVAIQFESDLCVQNNKLQMPKVIIVAFYADWFKSVHIILSESRSGLRL